MFALVKSPRKTIDTKKKTKREEERDGKIRKHLNELDSH